MRTPSAIAPAAKPENNGRLTATADFGTNGGNPHSRSGTVPARSGSVLVTSTTYNDAGWAETVTDPRGLATASFYDALGRPYVRRQNFYANGVWYGYQVSRTFDKAGHVTGAAY